MSVADKATDPFLARLQAHVQVTPRPADADAYVPGSSEPVRLTTRGDQLAFWQSPIARGEINRRITGDAGLPPESYFAATHGPAIPAPCALSLRATDPRLELALVQAGSCERVIGLDTDELRVKSANANVPDVLREKIGFRTAAFASWEAEEPLGAVLARSVLHRLGDLEDTLDRVRSMLVPGGLVFVDDFIGPARFQWTAAQLEAINRLLACLPEEMLVDLTAVDGRRKRSVSRPKPEEFAASNPHDAVRSNEILRCLDERFERADVHLHGGAVYHQLFTRIMGNFASRPELVRMVMEVDAMLTDSGVLASDYVWGVWRRPG